MKKTSAAKTKTSLTWPLILVLLFVFFPLGIMFLILKLCQDVSNRIRHGLLLTILGLIAAVIAIFRMASAYLYFAAFPPVRGSIPPGTVRFLFLLLPALMVLGFGISLLRRGIQDKKLLDLLCRQGFTSFEDLCLLLHTSKAGLCDRLEVLKAEGLISNMAMDYSRQQVTLPGRQDSFPDLFLDSGPVSCSLDEGKTLSWKEKIIQHVTDRTLWIASAATVLGGALLLLPGLLLASAATAAELRVKPARENPLIRSCGIAIAMFVLMMIETVGFSPYRYSGFEEPALFFWLFLPCLVLSLYDLGAYHLFSRRAYRKKRLLLIREKYPDLPEETIAELCGFSQ